MRRLSAFLQSKNIYDIISCGNKTGIPNQTQIQNLRTQCDVFISHRGVDTKRNIAVLLHNNLVKHKIHAFLDCKTLKPGDKLFDTIESAICECKIGLVLFSPRYCESYHCLHELALLVEMKKKLIPIYCDVNVHQLKIIDDGMTYHSKDVERFRYALEEAKSTVGIDFNSLQGDWLQLLEDASTSVKKNLFDVDKFLEKTYIY